MPGPVSVRPPAKSAPRWSRSSPASAFSKSGQLASFLRFVVQETLAGRGDRIKAYTIATAALGRDDNFDPQIDPIVRVEAGRLRRALRHYYANEGSSDPVVIDLPVGHYTPVFRRSTGPARPRPPRPGSGVILPTPPANIARCCC